MKDNYWDSTHPPPTKLGKLKSKVDWLVVEPTPFEKYARQIGSSPQGSG